MARVVRILIYDGSDEDLEKQLGQGINDGERPGLGTVRITAITLSGRLLAGVQAAIADIVQDAWERTIKSMENR